MPEPHSRLIFLRRTPAEQRRIAALYATGISAAILADQYDINIPTVLDYVRFNGGIVRHPGRPVTYSHNPHAFNELTPKAAYWIGFLMADGCIVGDEDRIKIALAIKDWAHLRKLRTFLQSTHPVKTVNGGTAALYEINSPTIIADLRKYGVQRTKSHTAMASTALIKNRDFWRGVVDGDGYIGFWRKYPNLELTGSRPLLHQFCWFVRLSCPHSKATVCPTKTVYRIRLRGSSAQTIVRKLYEKSVVSLDRKQTIAQLIMEDRSIVQYARKKRVQI